MSPEAQRIAIAEACPHLFSVRKSRFGHDQLFWNFDGEEGGACDPLTDLNAMHEAEKVLLTKSVINRRSTPFHAYFETLHTLCRMPDDTFDKPMQPEHWAICATAAQRAEAFLRTLNLWQP